MIPWLLSGIALVGAGFLAARRPVEAQALWLVSNLGWAAVSASRHDWALAALFLGMLSVTVFGLASWTRAERDDLRRPRS